MSYCVYRTLKNELSFCSLRVWKRQLSRLRILGIETSCDDTGAAVVDEEGNILGNALHSQTAKTVA